jgi:hypothetical protein
MRNRIIPSISRRRRYGGCVKSLSTAKALYSRVYEESKERLLQYFDTQGNFSDAAFQRRKHMSSRKEDADASS